MHVNKKSASAGKTPHTFRMREVGDLDGVWMGVDSITDHGVKEILSHRVVTSQEANQPRVSVVKLGEETEKGHTLSPRSTPARPRLTSVMALNR